MFASTFIIATAFLFASATTAAPLEHPELLPTVLDIAEHNADLSTLVTAVKAAGLTGIFANPSATTTLFAPTNEAFKALPAGVLDHLLKPENKQELIHVLAYHATATEHTAASLNNGEIIKTLEGKNFFVGINKNGAFINTAKITKTDIQASNGIVHVIDAVLLPEANTTIAQAAVADKNLTTLVTALKAAGLVTLLSGPGTFTVFAPTDAAFKALPAGVLDNLLKPENKAELINVLKYHVVGRVAFSTFLTNGETLVAENAKALSVSVGAGSVHINDAKVTIPNVFESNGVVHVIDKVLLPPKML